jgi:hypothetical protein
MLYLYDLAGNARPYRITPFTQGYWQGWGTNTHVWQSTIDVLISQL